METVTVPPMIVKTLIALLVGGLTFGVSFLADADNSTNLIIGLFVGGAAMVVQSMVDFERRLEQVTKSVGDDAEAMRMAVAHSFQAIQSTVHDGFEDINEATQVFAALQAHPLPTDEVVQLVRDAADARSNGHPLVGAFARSEIERVASLMRDLKADQVEYEGEDRDWLLGLTRCATSSIWAISTELDVPFWPSELGRRYLAAQREAAGRGISVRRLFIVDERNAVGPGLLQACEVHRELGFEVRVAFRKEMPVGVDTKYGYILFDQAITYEVVPEDGARHEQPAVAATRLVLREDRVARLMDGFVTLWETGVEVEELQVPA